ncbi:hypothetical protein GCM10022248_15790 [Nonomuraea soli]
MSGVIAAPTDSSVMRIPPATIGTALSASSAAGMVRLLMPSIVASRAAPGIAREAAFETFYRLPIRRTFGR